MYPCTILYFLQSILESSPWNMHTLGPDPSIPRMSFPSHPGGKSISFQVLWFPSKEHAALNFSINLVMLRHVILDRLGLNNPFFSSPTQSRYLYPFKVLSYSHSWHQSETQLSANRQISFSVLSVRSFMNMGTRTKNCSQENLRQDWCSSTCRFR